MSPVEGTYLSHEDVCLLARRGDTFPEATPHE